ncbi:hypothetical protein BU15DRAFT_61023 [Melanogaster broomeanus]|nr:hypothetical protein BU15DRAFT_61023 [Melanogaster broomeanus]
MMGNTTHPLPWTVSLEDADEAKASHKAASPSPPNNLLEGEAEEHVDPEEAEEIYEEIARVGPLAVCGSRPGVGFGPHWQMAQGADDEINLSYLSARYLSPSVTPLHGPRRVEYKRLGGIWLEPMEQMNQEKALSKGDRNSSFKGIFRAKTSTPRAKLMVSEERKKVGVYAVPL